MPTDLEDKNRNLPGGTVQPVAGSKEPDILADIDVDKTFEELTGGLDMGKETQELLAGIAEEESTPGPSPVQDFYEDRLGVKPATARGDKPDQSPGKPIISRPDKPTDDTSGSGKTGSHGGSSGSEAKGLSNILDQENEAVRSRIQSRMDGVKNQKVSKYNLRGRSKKKVKLLLLGAVFAVAAAVPIGVLGVIPHALQNWVENRVSEYTERAVDKMGQRVLYTFIRDRVAIDKCRGSYVSIADKDNRCRPRLNERDGRLSQLFNDWNAAKMEDVLAKHGIAVEYDPTELSGGGKPYKIYVDGENFIAAGPVESSTDGLYDRGRDWDVAEFMGKRATSLKLKAQMKTALKEDTRWWDYLKRRNMKAGYLRDLGLPGTFYGGEKLATKLDDFDVSKSAIKTKFRQNLTQFVVSKGNARVGALLEILLSGESSKGTPSEIVKNNKVLAAAAKSMKAGDVEKLLVKYAGKNLQEINIQIMKDLISKLSEKLAQKFGETATKAIPVIGWVLLGFTVLDMVDLATDGTLQHWISSQNSQSMIDVSNLMDTSISEEKRGYVDAASAGDMRLSLVNGLGSSRVFSNMVGYQSPSGKKAAGYECKPDVSISDFSSLMGAGGQIFGDGDPTAGSQIGMSDDQDTCENHRVDYDPLVSASGFFGLAQAALTPYTEDCILQTLTGTGVLPNIPGCPSAQKAYHGLQGGISWLLDNLGLDKVAAFFSSFPPLKALMANVTGWMTNAVSILITGQSLAGPELLQGGLNTDTKSGARLVDAWAGGSSAMQNAFAEGAGDGGGLGGVALSGAQAAELNNSIAAERRDELASSSFFDRMFDISHTDTLASGLLGMAVTEGGVENFINPASNIALAFNTANSSAYAASPEQQYCSQTNNHGDAVDEFGTLCKAIPDDFIDNMTDEEMQQFSDPEFCEAHTAAIDAKKKAAESDVYTLGTQNPDGTGKPTEIDGCRLMGTTTDVMGTNFRKDDKIYGFEYLTNSNSSDGSSSVSLENVECPAGELETKQVGGTTYYRMPEDPSYVLYGREARQYGTKELVCVLYSVGKAYEKAMNGKSRLYIGDLNAGAPHKSHKYGTAVDVDAGGEIAAADRTGNAAGVYSTDATVTLGKLFVDTGMLRNIWWCPNDDSTEQIMAYAQSVGKPIEGTIKCIAGHANHFHVDILQEFRGEDVHQP